MRRHEGSKFQQATDSCISFYQCNDCNGRFTTLPSTEPKWQCGHVGSVELWNVKDVKPAGSYWATCDDASFDGLRSHPVDIDSHKLMNSWKVVHQCKHVNTHWWTTFQLLSFWLSMSTRLHVTSNDTCVVISRPVESSRRGTQGVCIAGVNFLLPVYHLNFDNFWQSVFCTDRQITNPTFS